jgi:Flp pilus assembly protein protease CpaA
MTIIFTLANIGILAYGAITDYNKREIPNTVPIVLLLTGLATGWEVIIYRLAGMLLTAAVFFIAAKLTKSDLPGGDFKLLSAMAFSSGIPILIASLLLTGLGATIVGIAVAMKTHCHWKQPTKRHIPLCSYIAPAYTIVCGLQIIAIL